MRTFKNSILGICLILLNTCAVSAQKTVQGLNDFLASVQSGSKLPGFAVTIIKNDAVLFSGGYGYSDRLKKTPFTLQTVQPVGGISNMVVGLSLMQAIEKGYFNLETPINDLLPFKIINPWLPGSVIRIRDLATHVSSLVDNDTGYRKAYGLTKLPVIQLKDFLREYYVEGGAYYSKSNFSNSAPGKKYSFSTIASSLAAYIIELKANSSFDKFTAQNIFAPLKMNDSHWFFEDARINRYATLYEVNRQENPIYQIILNKDGSLKPYTLSTFPSEGLKSSVADLTLFLMAMIKGYSGVPGIINKKSFETLFEKQFTPANMPASIDAREPNRAIFWAYNRRGKIALVGNNPGLSTFISFDPLTKIGRILVINTRLEGLDNIVTIEAFVNLIKGLDNFEQGK